MESTITRRQKRARAEAINLQRTQPSAAAWWWRWQNDRKVATLAIPRVYARIVTLIIKNCNNSTKWATSLYMRTKCNLFLMCSHFSCVRCCVGISFFEFLLMFPITYSVGFERGKRVVDALKDKKQREQNFIIFWSKGKTPQRREVLVNLITQKGQSSKHACLASYHTSFCISRAEMERKQVQITMRLIITFCNLINQKHIEFHVSCKDAAYALMRSWFGGAETHYKSNVTTVIMWWLKAKKINFVNNAKLKSILAVKILNYFKFLTTICTFWCLYS